MRVSGWEGRHHKDWDGIVSLQVIWNWAKLSVWCKNKMQSWLWHWYTFYKLILQTHSRILLAIIARLSVRESDVRCGMMKSGDPGHLILISSGSPSKWFTSPSLLSWWDFISAPCQWFSSSPYHPQHDAGAPPITTWTRISTDSTHHSREHPRHSASPQSSRRITTGAVIKDVSTQGWSLTMTLRVIPWIISRKKSPQLHTNVSA